MNAPKDFEKTLGKLPAGITITDDPKKPFDSLHWFVTGKKEVDVQASKILKLLKPGATVWAYYPKGSSKIQTDLTRDKGWETLLQYDLKWLSLISFDDTWSTFAFRLKTEQDKKEEAKPKERPIFQYADSATKTITLPEDLAKVFKQHPDAKKLFDALSFSHRREYVEWVVTAKREETRNKRVQDTMKMLVEKKKNPTDK